jgi:hypothetical protein
MVGSAKFLGKGVVHREKLCLSSPKPGGALAVSSVMTLRQKSASVVQKPHTSSVAPSEKERLIGSALSHAAEAL